MPLHRLVASWMVVALVCGLGIAGAHPAVAGDKVKVGVFPVAAALPYFVALKRGYFAEEGIEPETVVLGTPALLVQSLVTRAVDAASNLVTMEGANINARRPGTLKYFALIGQNSDHVFEQFVVRADSPARTLADLKGAKLFTSPGPANIGISKAVLAKAGLKDGADYQMQEQPLGMQMGALKSGNFEGGYTLEPTASMMIRSGVARRIEAGVISTYLIENPKAQAYAAGPALSGAFIKDKPDLAGRFAKAWFKAMADVARDPSVRAYLVSDMNVAPEVADEVPLPHFVPARDLSGQQIADFQTFIDVGVTLKVVAAPIDVRSMLVPF